ncbi:MAG: endo-1,4-beta-xylanase [Treponema sp.]|jgi:endo-1,4-beta-xylanase|nr:endo-1,4-beta-xylanase [Treponema sp.]
MKKYLLIAILCLSSLLFLSQTPPNNVNGFFGESGSFEILRSYQGKNNVLKVNSTKTQWSIFKYSLAQYRGTPITIEFSADVRREGSAGMIKWQINNEPGFPSLSELENASPRVWHSMRGRIIITPTNNYPELYLTNYGVNSPTIFYLANPTITITTGNPLNPDLSLTPLKSVYENDFLIGNITNYDGIYMSGKYFDLLKHHYNIVTSAGTYPFQLAPSSKGGAYRFAEADNIVNIAVRNNIRVHGHTLAWYGDDPSWLTEGSREEVIQNLNNYITTVVRHFRGRIASWDVINEAIKPNVTNAEARGNWKNCIINSQNASWVDNRWYSKLGADYIEIAFRAARAADSNITLYYNDNDLENPNKAEVVRKMIQDINDRYKTETGGTRNLIEGVGSQTHIGSSTSSANLNINFNNIRTSLEKLCSLGIEVAITELDISVDGYNRGQGKDSTMSERDALAQAVLYARLMNLFREYSTHIKFVTFWGVDDNTSWLSGGNPTLFDWRLNAKPAFHAVSDPDGFLARHGGRTRR